MGVAFCLDEAFCFTDGASVAEGLGVLAPCSAALFATGCPAFDAGLALRKAPSEDCFMQSASPGTKAVQNRADS